MPNAELKLTSLRFADLLQFSAPGFMAHHGSEKSSGISSPKMLSARDPSVATRVGFATSAELQDVYSSVPNVIESGASTNSMVSSTSHAKSRAVAMQDNHLVTGANQRQHAVPSGRRSQDSISSSSMSLDYSSNAPYNGPMDSTSSASHTVTEPARGHSVTAHPRTQHLSSRPSPSHHYDSAFHPQLHLSSSSPSIPRDQYHPSSSPSSSSVSHDARSVQRIETAARIARKRRHQQASTDQQLAPLQHPNAPSTHPSSSSSWQNGDSMRISFPIGTAAEDFRPRRCILTALGQSQDLVIKLIEENHVLRKRLDVALSEIHRVRTLP